MSRETLRADVMDAMICVVMRRIEDRIRGLRCDDSATADTHTIGLHAGFNMAKRKMLEILADEGDPS
jgi:hypothetical protein